MPKGQYNLEWLNHNAQRSYPIVAGATKKDTTNGFTIPDDFLVSLDLAVPVDLGARGDQFFLRQIGSYASGFQLTFACTNGSETIDVATTIVPVFEGTNRVFSLVGTEPNDDVYGKVCIGRLGAIRNQPAGLFSFDLVATRLEPQTIRPCIRGIPSIRIGTAGGSYGPRIYGPVEFVAGANMQISLVETSEAARIVFSAISGAGTIEDCVCEGDAASIPCIKTINGISAGPDNNINIIGDDCIQTANADRGINLIDECCKPCCGCEELEKVTRALEQLAMQRETVLSVSNQLASAITSLSTNVLGSRLGDRRCLTCD